MSATKKSSGGFLSVGPAGSLVEAESAPLLDGCHQGQLTETAKDIWMGAKDFEGLPWWQMPSVSGQRLLRVSFLGC